MDFTARNVSIANKFQTHGILRWEYQNEGEIVNFNEVTCESMGYDRDDLQKIEFI